MSHNLFVPAGATVTVPLNYSYPHPDPGLPPPHDMKIETDNPSVANAKLADDGRAVVITGSGDGTAMISIGNKDISDQIHVTVARAAPNAVSADTNMARYEMAHERGNGEDHPADQRRQAAIEADRRHETAGTARRG